MSHALPNESPEKPFIQQTDFEQITSMVSAEFQIEEALIEHNVPTFYLKQPQETKQPFLKLLERLETMGLTAVLRKKDDRVVFKVVPKPQVKPSNILINWLLFFVTIVTTFITGYTLSLELTDPLIGGAAFTIAIMAILGTHEMGHKLTADKKGIEATPPYFIPGPPPIGGLLGGIGTFGAVIMQKSLPPNKDALFDVGSNGPVVGFVIATIVTAVGLTLSIPMPPPEEFSVLPVPLLWILLSRFLDTLGLLPLPPPDQLLFMHPVAFAGWVGMILTMLNLLPAAMLDGGHVARCLAGEKTRTILAMLSVLLLILRDFWPMAILVLFLSMYKHPGPLDDVSNLSTGRKLWTVLLVAVFVLSFPFF